MDATEFLVYLYFGDVTNPTVAAIDRAYRDMAAHTVRGRDKEEIFKNRKKFTEELYANIFGR